MITLRMKTSFTVAAFMAVVSAGAIAGATESRPVPTETAGRIFATVGESVITLDEYQAALAAAIRQKYYHAKPPEAELASLQREVGDRLINRVLLLAEVKRRGIEPDHEKIRKIIDGYEERYKNSEQWKANREKLLPGLIEQLERQSLLERIEAAVRVVPAPAESELKAYYEAHRDLFTEPEQVRVSLILLTVDPSSASAVWDKAREEADGILKRLRNGADFAELARLHSGDASAERGGDMGYLHRGMLPEVAESAVDKLQPGMVSEPVKLLEGFALIRLDDRKTAKLRSFDEVKERATGLWQREQGESAWNKLIAELRETTPVKVDESKFLPLNQDGKNGQPQTAK